MRKIPHLRWWIVALLFLATAISYVDRQTLAVVAPTLRDDLGISNFGYARILSSFLIAYTIMQPVTGWMIDRIGTRKGFAVIMLWWSAAAMLHGFGRGVMSFSIFRFLLGAGEAGSWAACVRAVSEWLPKHERGLANGIWGAGTSVGLVVSVPFVAWITLWLGWRTAFVLTGLLGLVWVFVWWVVYRLPEQHPLITPPELELIRESEPVAPSGSHIPYLSLLRSRSVWAVVLARFFADPNSWFYHYWLPEYFKTRGRLQSRRDRPLRVDSLCHSGGRYLARRIVFRSFHPKGRSNHQGTPGDHGGGDDHDDRGGARRLPVSDSGDLHWNQCGDIRFRAMGPQHDVALWRGVPSRGGGLGDWSQRNGGRARRLGPDTRYRLARGPLWLLTRLRLGGYDAARRYRCAIHALGKEG